jgi:hypothetical protein
MSPPSLASASIVKMEAKCRLTLNGLHGIAYQETELFITTAVRSSTPSYYFELRQSSEFIKIAVFRKLASITSSGMYCRMRKEPASVGPLGRAPLTSLNMDCDPWALELDTRIS